MIRTSLLTLLCAVAVGLVGCDAVAPTDAPTDAPAVASADGANAIARPTLSSSATGNLRIDLSWTAVSGATHYEIERVNLGYRGTIADGTTNVGTATSATDYPYEEPDFGYFYRSGQPNYACYRVIAHNAQGESAASLFDCWAVGGSSGGF